MSSIAFINEEEDEDEDEDQDGQKATLHNNLFEQQKPDATKESKVKIFEDTMASDLAQLIAEFNPKDKRLQPQYKMGYFAGSTSNQQKPSPSAAQKNSNYPRLS